MNEPSTTAPELEIRVNGDPRTVAPGSTVADLLRQLELLPAMVVVERNREILPREAAGETPLAHGDTLEIVHFVGGG
jgi:thiamine biosynthesis protein ThiS